jgi:hypothetical protein
VPWSREDLDERVETLADAHEGREFVEAVSRFAEEELEPDERDLLGAVLLERADEEHAFQEAARRRAREPGWWRRTVRRVEDLIGDSDVGETAARAAAAVLAEDAGRIEVVVAELRADRGRAARAFDQLSRDRDPAVRGWVAGVAREVLEEGGVYVLMGLTRDGDREVRDTAVAELALVDPDAARRLVPALRRRARSQEPEESVPAIWVLARLRDSGSLPLVRQVAESEDADRSRRKAAEAAAILLGERPREILERMRAHDHDLMPWLAVAARLLANEEARAMLAERAEGAPDAECRAVCRAELEKLEEEAAP